MFPPLSLLDLNQRGVQDTGPAARICIVGQGVGTCAAVDAVFIRVVPGALDPGDPVVLNLQSERASPPQSNVDVVRTIFTLPLLWFMALLSIHCLQAVFLAEE